MSQIPRIATAKTNQVKVARDLCQTFRSRPPIKTKTNAAGRNAIPIYRVINANPSERADAINREVVGWTTYMDKRIRLERENMMKRGSDHAIACASMIEAVDIKKNQAQMLATIFRFVIK